MSCAQLDGSVSWSNITKKNDAFWILVGAPVSKNINNTKKQFESDPGLQLKSSRTSSRKNAGQRSRKGAFEMIDFFQHGKFTHFPNGSFRVYVCLVHQDFQNKNKIEIVKRSRHNGKVFATELFTVCDN